MINNDIVLEDIEAFNISITSITNDHIVGTPGVATVTIIDTTSKYFLSFAYVHYVYVCMYVLIIQYVHTYIHVLKSFRQWVTFV